MLRQIRLLTSVQLCNLFGINEYRHTGDRGKKRRWIALAAVWVFLLVFLEFFVVSASLGLGALGMGELIPRYLFASVSLITLVFSFLKAGSVIFQMSSYETLAALPVTGTAIVVSRFLTMYVTNLAMSLLVMVPGLIICGLTAPAGTDFWIFGLVGTLFLPLLPITIATALGAGITAISSRMKRKSLVSSVLTVLFVVAALIGSSLMGRTQGLDEEMMKDLAAAASAQIGRIYPPAAWFGESVGGGGVAYFLLFLAVSAGLFLVTVFLLQRRFGAICSALNASSAKNNYKLGALKTASPVRAMVGRELRRYFASSIYVSNTIIGYILMVAASAALLIAGRGALETALNMPGILDKGLPFVLSLVAIISPMTSCSISMEGRQWWIAQSLPVSSRAVFDSKILANLTIAAPAWLLSTILCLLAVRPSFLQGLWLALIPGAYILFSTVAGITINLALPVMHWDNEVRVVKQSASTLVAMLTGLIVVMIPAVLVFSGADIDTAAPITILAVLAVTALLYARNGKRELVTIG